MVISMLFCHFLEISPSNPPLNRPFDDSWGSHDSRAADASVTYSESQALSDVAYYSVFFDAFRPLLDLQNCDIWGILGSPPLPL